MHRQRILSALLLIPLFLLLVHYGSPFHFALLIGVAVALAAWEFSCLCPVGKDAGLSLITVAGALAWHAAAVGRGDIALVGALVAGAGLTRAMVGKMELRVNVLQAAWAVLGVTYVGGLLSFAGLLRMLPEGRELIYLVTFTTWVGDTAAFYVGSRFGRRFLAPRISPKKTVEGALGGIGGAIVTALVGSLWVWPRIGLASAAWVGLVLAMVCILGDLCESVVKRAAAVKDSGNLIPGHGGVLDRLDSLMFACPTLYALARLGWF
jgi:phosphatidate cytidylyltransferase